MKQAIILVSFGTTHKDTRSLTIDSFAQEVASLYPDWDVFQAYTSKIVRQRILDQEGLEVWSIDQAMEHCLAAGYQSLVLQSTHIIPGGEFHKIYRLVRKYRGNHVKIRIGSPLLDKFEDYHRVVDHLHKKHGDLQEDQLALYMAHGTEHAAFTSYLALDYLLDQGKVRMACVEGQMTLEAYLGKIKATKAKEIHLYPFMFVAGDHAKNDLAGEEDSWKSLLEDQGYQVTAHLEGLGQDPLIRQIFLDHLQEAIQQESRCRHAR